jgi:hypothetical protein
MSVESVAVDEFAAWLNTRSITLGRQEVTAAGSPGFAKGLPAPHGALLLARDEEWELLVITAGGTRSNILGSVEADPACTLDALMFAVFQRATAELEHRDRTASVALSTFLKHLAEEIPDDRYSGRAAVLLAGHAITDGYELRARMRLEEAVRLFTAAGDIVGAESAQEALLQLPTLLRG